MRGEVREVLSALDELALNYDRKSQGASKVTETNRMLSEQISVRNVSTEGPAIYTKKLLM